MGDSRERLARACWVPPGCPVQLRGLWQTLPAALVVNGNLLPVSMAVGKIDTDSHPGGRGDPDGSRPDVPLPHLTWPEATSPISRLKLRCRADGVLGHWPQSLDQPGQLPPAGR